MDQLWPSRDTVPEFQWSDWGIYKIFSVTVASVSGDIRFENLPDKSIALRSRQFLSHKKYGTLIMFYAQCYNMLPFIGPSILVIFANYSGRTL
jgi:hypothetical protein